MLEGICKAIVWRSSAFKFEEKSKPFVSVPVTMEKNVAAGFDWIGVMVRRWVSCHFSVVYLSVRLFLFILS